MSDNHTKGNLNFAATRHGWTRNFTLTPEKVATISYATLESVLELNTLKIRAMSLRIFIEHPPASGSFVKIRPWKDDGTLQSILMKTFFEDRMKAGTTTNLDIRDGNIREDIGDGGKDGSIGAKEWLKAHGLTKTKSNNLNQSVGGDSQEQETEIQAAAPTGGAFFSAFGFGKPFITPTPPKSDEDASENDNRSVEAPDQKSKTEEDILRERGWGPPLMRRLTNRNLKSRKSQAHIEEKDIQEEGDGEEIEIPEAEEANGGARPEKNGLWRKHKNNTFLGSGKKIKKNGVEIIKTPSDALKPAPASPSKETINHL